MPPPKRPQQFDLEPAIDTRAAYKADRAAELERVIRWTQTQLENVQSECAELREDVTRWRGKAEAVRFWQGATVTVMALLIGLFVFVLNGWGKWGK